MSGPIANGIVSRIWVAIAGKERLSVSIPRGWVPCNPEPVLCGALQPKCSALLCLCCGCGCAVLCCAVRGCKAVLCE